MNVDMTTGYLVSASDFELLRVLESELLDGLPVLPLQQRALGLRLSTVRLAIAERPIIEKVHRPYSSDSMPLDETATEPTP